MSDLDAMREQASAKRAAGLNWEASRLETIIRRAQSAPMPLLATITVLTDLHEEALSDIARESEFRGSSFDEAVARETSLRSALVEIGAW